MLFRISETIGKPVSDIMETMSLEEINAYGAWFQLKYEMEMEAIKRSK